jgi:thioredoxin-dependent peroxiredoxin
VVGVSPDAPEDLAKFRAKHDLKVGLLSDPDHRVLETYDAWGPQSYAGKEYVGVVRSSVLVDPHGRIAHHWPKVKPAGHAAEVKARLQELV